MLIAGSLIAATLLAAQQATLSKAHRHALDRVFDHWTVTGAVSGDFNSDGQADLAAALKTGKGIRLVALLTRLEESDVIVIENAEGDAEFGTLGVIPRGKAYKDPDDKLDNYFGSDTLTVQRPGQPTTAYQWNGLSFRKLVLPDFP